MTLRARKGAPPRGALLVRRRVNTEEFAEFWRMQKCRVVRTPSCLWYSAWPFVFMSLPYHRAVVPTRSEVTRLLYRSPAAAIRYRDPTGTDGGLFVRSDRSYDLSSLERKARNQTRRGLEQCRIEQLDFAYLANHGPRLIEESCRRQGRDPWAVTGEASWQRYCRAASQFGDFEAWGSFVNGTLVAFLVAALVEDHYSILHQSSASAALRHYPNNALAFTITQQKLRLPEIGCVSYGLKSLDPTGGLDRFKLGMGYQIRPFGERVVLNPLLKCLATGFAQRLLRRMAQRHPEKDFWRKTSAGLDRLCGLPTG